MSLVCYECSCDMGPSESLPGREGVFVNPVVLSIVWIPANPNNSEKLDWLFTYLTSQEDRSLCFKCISSKLPEHRQQFLNSIYEAYEAETYYKEIEKSQKGKWISGDEMGRSVKAFKTFEEKFQGIASDECLICAVRVGDKKLPYFRAIVIDRVYGRQHQSGLFTFDNYSWSDIKTGLTSFKFCFDCFGSYFNKTFMQLSCDMRGVKNSQSGKNPKSEFFITEEAMAALKKEVGGKEAGEMMRKIMRKAKVIRLSHNN